ncbi:MAG: hypothetical protein JJ902_16020 [Roseibium sp.]|nr:hypothetical protein [Roseibium sp.]
MSHPDKRDEDLDEAPLDPAAERLQVKLRRLLFGSTLIMFAGLFAVFAAIFYKINTSDAPEAGDIVATIALEPGSVVESVTVSDDTLIMLVRQGEASSLVYADRRTGQILGTTAFVAR